MFRLIVAFALANLFSPSAYSDHARGVDLAAMGDWDLLVSEDAIASEKYAAEEFQHFFAEATGIRLPIVHAVDRPDHHIFIGPSDALRTSEVGKAMDGDLGWEEFRIVIANKHIAITGQRPRGTLYGVYTFLEDYLGIRFLTADVTHVPKIHRPRRLGPIDRSYRPPFAWRRYLKHELSDHPVFAVRKRMNRGFLNPDLSYDPAFVKQLGGEAPWRIGLHNSYGFDAPKSAFDEHPEHFMILRGKRSRAQPCVSHPEVRRIILEQTLRKWQEVPPGTTKTLAQNDGPGPCECDLCAEIQREGDPPGSIPVPDKPPLGLGKSDPYQHGPPSAVVIDFVNHIAEKFIERTGRSDVFFQTQAYAWSMMPPRKTRVHPNVKVIFAVYHGCNVHAFDDPSCPVNPAVDQYVTGWKEKCDYLFIWDYDTNFREYLLPYPNLRVRADRLRYYLQNNARDVFIQGGWRNAEFADLRAYMVACLLWDPSRDSEQLIDEFVRLYYGKSAPFIRRWIDMIHDQVEARGVHPDVNGPAESCGLDAELGEKGLALFDQAMEVAETDEIRRRVEKVSITAWRLAVEPVWYNAIEADRQANRWKKPVEQYRRTLKPGEKERLRPMVRRLFELIEKHEISRYAEGRDIDNAKKEMHKYYGLEQGQML